MRKASVKGKNIKKRVWRIASTVLTVGLVALAFYQANELWKMRFNMDLLGRVQTVAEKENEANEILKPAGVLYVTDAKASEYFVRLDGDDEAYRDVQKLALAWLKQFFTADVLVQNTASAPESATECRLTYATTLPSALFTEMYTQVLPEFAFDELRLQPAKDGPSRLILVNTESAAAMVLEAEAMPEDDEATQPFLTRLRATTDAKAHWIDALSAYPELFTTVQYIRTEDSEEPMKDELAEVRTYKDEKAALRAAAPFVRYVDTVGITEVADGWFLADDMCTMKIHQDGFLEYVRTTSSKTKLPLHIAYQKAWKFVNADAHSDRLVLTSVQPTDTGYRFMWQYRIGAYLINDPNLEMALEMRGEDVARYERTLLQFTVHSYEAEPAREGLFAMLGRLGIVKPDTLRCQYRVHDGTAVLYWNVADSDKEIWEKVA